MLWRRNHSELLLLRGKSPTFDLLLFWNGQHYEKGIFSTKDLWTPQQRQHATYSIVECVLEMYKKKKRKMRTVCTRERSSKRNIKEDTLHSFLIAHVESIILTLCECKCVSMYIHTYTYICTLYLYTKLMGSNLHHNQLSPFSRRRIQQWGLWCVNNRKINIKQ